MKSNQVWKLVNLPINQKAIKNKWNLRIKHKTEGNIERFKTLLIAKMHTQQERIDYEETFSSVVPFTLIRLILSLMDVLNLKLSQINVKTPFLNGELEEKLYMKKLVGFVNKGKEQKYIFIIRSYRMILS